MICKKSTNSIFQNNEDTWDISYLAEHEVVCKTESSCFSRKPDVLCVVSFSQNMGVTYHKSGQVKAIHSLAI
jgi:hypothetical protein